MRKTKVVPTPTISDSHKLEAIKTIALDALSASQYEYREYDFGTFIDAAIAASKLWPQDCGVTGEGKFYGNKTFDQAINYARMGNPHVTKLVKLYSDKIEQQFTFSSTCDYMPDVTGQVLDVGTMLTGNPECWLQPIESPSLKSDKLVEISVDSTFSGSTSVDAMAYRGALLAALIDALRVRGFSVKLTLTYCSMPHHGYTSLINGATYRGWVNKVIVVNYGEVVDLSRIAFALADISMYRRMEFVCKDYFKGESDSCMSMAASCPKEHRSKIHFGANEGLYDISGAPTERQLTDAVNWLESKISSLTETLNS